MLVWVNPADASITGYQVLRGPDAASLVVIEQDTASSGTSYTDTAPPAGQTHTYAVKARNAVGLSPLSNTITATVPAAEEELITARHTAADNTLVSNLGQTGGDSAFVGPNPGSTNEISVSFTTGDNPFGYHLTSVQLNIRTALVADTNTPNPQASIRVDNGGTPSETVLSLLNTSTVITTDYQLTTFTKPDEVTIQLQPDTIYWLYISATGTAAGVEKTSSNDQDAESQADWRINDVRIVRTDGGAWTTDVEGDTLKMKILGHVAPPPTLVSNLGQTNAENAEVDHFAAIGQPFVAGPSLAGFGYRLQGIRVSASAGEVGGMIRVPTVKAVLREDANGNPAANNLLSLTVPDDFASTTDLTEYTLSAPPGTVLRGGARYWVVLGAQDMNPLFISATTSTAEDQAPPPFDGWRIGDERYTDQVFGGYVSHPQPIKLAVLGEPGWLTDEPLAIDEDFPGADYNAHETRGRGDCRHGQHRPTDHRRGQEPRSNRGLLVSRHQTGPQLPRRGLVRQQPRHKHRGIGRDRVSRSRRRRLCVRLLRVRSQPR